MPSAQRPPPARTGHRLSIATLLLGLLCAIIMSAGLVRPAHAWDSEELEIFDLVEEVNENFYKFMGLQPDCTLPELKRAFRNLSVALHPDKNNGIDEDNRFRKLVTIYEVLKDTSKRAKYDLVLKNGLPNWKSAMYYYRRVHKMGLTEMAAIVFGIVTVGQYIIAWAAYMEKKFTAESLLGSKLKRNRRGGGAGGKGGGGVVDFEQMLEEIPRPSVFNTLPFQIPRAIWYTPRACRDAYRHYRAYQLAQEAELAAEREAAEQQRQRDEEYVREKEAKKIGLKKRKEKFAAQEKTDEELEGFAKLQHIKKLESIQAAQSRASAANGGGPASSGGFWSDDDLVELIRLVKKHPGGTPARWEVIAEQMNRSVTEITFMAAKMKEKGYRLPGQTTATMATDSVAETLVAQETSRLKAAAAVCAPTIAVPETTNWSQEQQRQLETALTKFPRQVDGGGDRWSLIAGDVAGKSREECVERYKHLVQMLKAKTTTTTSSKAAEQRAQPQHDEEERPTAGGKRRNKRKERKKNMDFSTDEEDDE